MRWEMVKLKDACSKIGSGATPNGGATNYISTGICFIRSQNVYNLHFEYNGLAHITELAAKKLSNVTVYQNDVLLNITGDSVARTCLVPRDVLPARVNQHVAILRVDSNKLDPRFLCYFLASPNMQNYMLGLAVGKGASRNAMTKTMIGEFDIPYPSMETQKRIADILSAYDDLIESNQKQIKLLEEAAQRLYKEWFIDLHFPGYETTPIVNGIPEGWGYVPLHQLIQYEIGGGWGSDTITNECESPAYVIRGTDLYDLTHGNCNEIPYRYHSKTNLMARVLQDGDIIFEVSGGSKTEGVARTALIRRAILEQFGGQVMCASFCKLIRPANAKMSQYLYDTFLYLRSSGETAKYDKRSASSIVNYRWKDFLKQQMILVPSEVVLEKYNNLSGNIYQKILSCSRAIQTAKIARDRLLPKLMSGEIEV